MLALQRFYAVVEDLLGIVGVGSILGVVDGTLRGSPLPTDATLLGQGVKGIAGGAFPLVMAKATTQWTTPS